jgi:hypothetical protein
MRYSNESRCSLAETVDTLNLVMFHSPNTSSRSLKKPPDSRKGTETKRVGHVRSRSLTGCRGHDCRDFNWRQLAEAVLPATLMIRVSIEVAITMRRSLRVSQVCRFRMFFCHRVKYFSPRRCRFLHQHGPRIRPSNDESATQHVFCFETAIRERYAGRTRQHRHGGRQRCSGPLLRCGISSLRRSSIR